ncbi:MAG: fasciclin domain-containing protein [Rhodobacteraceae bacterium]|nr:fasciclin domain-containing protein [Paracoccaceae bacterium]
MNRRTFARLAVLAAAAATVAACAREPEQQSISDVITSNASFGTLATALQRADLIGTLDGDGSYTVFAPRNSAFAALPDGVLDNLLLPENRPALAAVLGAHVVRGEIFAAELVNQTTEITTLDGTSFTVDGFDGVKITGAAGGAVTVVQPDVMARNGVIHVIDGILLP